MSSMNTNQSGFVSGTLISLVVAVVFLLGAIGFGAWAYSERQDYKLNSDQKAAAAAEEAKKETEKAEAVKYAEEAKNPLKTHKAPDQFGGVTIQFPKTWSGYVVEKSTGSTSVDDYFHPGVVPSAEERDSVFALRVQVVGQAYDKVVKEYESGVESGKLTAAPYAFPKVPSVTGLRFSGEIEPNKQGSMVIVPMRNLTLKVWTESPSYVADFDNIILPNLTFSP